MIAQILEAAGYHRLPTAAAVWEKAPEHGERIEFFQPHRGPAALLGRIRPVEEQLGLQALSLGHLWVLKTFTDFVLVPAPDDGGQPAPVRIPLLGAFVLNKSNTFSLRGSGDGPARSAKDILYLRDVMAAGNRARTALDADVEAMLGSGESQGEILSERDGVEPAAARADVEGYLTDLIELLEVRVG